jgi:hypothetical protein
MNDRKRTATCLIVAGCLSLQAPYAWSAPAAAESRFVLVRARLSPTDQSSDFTPPEGKILVITDIVIQNRVPGDGPVTEDAFSRIFLNTDPGDMVLSVVGNQTLDLHFSTGLRVKGSSFRALNAVNSTAPFVEILISGYLAKRPPGF